MITLPIWLVILVSVLAAFTLVNHFFLPATRWFLRRRLNRVIEEVNTRLRIQLPTFQLTKREVLIDRLTYDGEVMKAVEESATRRGIPRDAVMAEVASYAREMVPAFNAYFYFRMGYWVTRRFVRAFYRVRLGYLDDSSLGQISPNTAVVFFINHRSNMDYMLVSYLASRSAVLSYGAGEWARVWPFIHLLRVIGAYIVRRNTTDPLYRKVLERYVQMATASCVPHAIFAEGMLSRDGSVGTPKLGLLAYLTRTFDPEGEIDIMFLPVGTNYDRVMEEHTLTRNPDTDFRGRGTIFVLGSTLRTLGGHFLRKLIGNYEDFGTASASFGRPISFKAWLRQQEVDFRQLDKPGRFKYVERLADELMDRVRSVIPILPMPVLATVFREAEGPMSELEVKNRAHELIEELRDSGAHIAMQEGAEDQAVNDSLQTMVGRELVQVEPDGSYQARQAETALLDYYATSIAHLRPVTKR